MPRTPMATTAGSRMGLLATRPKLCRLGAGQNLAGFWLASGWLLAGFWLASGWLLAGFWLASGWLLAGFWLASGWLLAGFLLSDLWPPSSPDAAPLDYGIWGFMKSKACATPRPNVDALKASVKKEWANMLNRRRIWILF